jgi:hypothetical protein
MLRQIEVSLAAIASEATSSDKEVMKKIVTLGTTRPPDITPRDYLQSARRGLHRRVYEEPRGIQLIPFYRFSPLDSAERVSRFAICLANLRSSFAGVCPFSRICTERPSKKAPLSMARDW